MSTETIPSTIKVLDPAPRAQRMKPYAGAPISWKWYFGFFFISGFCSILYELIWLRLAMAQFGVTTAMVSIVLSSFMAGLGLGSWGAGYLVRKYGPRLKSPRLHLYAIAELCIGCSAVVLPLEFLIGRLLLEKLGNIVPLSSSGYYVAAGMVVLCSLIPWCACIGATIPLAMFAIRSERRLESERAFSFLYLANVLGAVAGALIPLLLIEVFGFTRTLQCGMLLNLVVCGAALKIAKKQVPQTLENEIEQDASSQGSPTMRQVFGDSTLWLLFATGLTAMGMEVVWTRQFAVYIGNLVYSFASILGVYLVATFIGSIVYRIWSRRRSGEGTLVWLFVWIAGLIPLLTADSRLRMPINVIGCILGPLVAGFVLLPYLDERIVLIVLALPWLLIALSLTFFLSESDKRFTVRNTGAFAAVLMASCALIFMTKSYVQLVPGGAQVRRDSTATVIAAGQGMAKGLYVNGVSMTFLTPMTKQMSAMPLAFLDHAPQNALVICFGMGTTHRSMLSWGIDSTAVDLVPGVPALFWYYHGDAPQLVKSPHSHVVVDDGRRFLERTTGQYDVIVIDPPPPIGAAGSSLLYSREFYSAAKKRLRTDGILQQWYPGGDLATTAAIARALKESFPYVRAFVSLDGVGIHYLASQQAIPIRSAAELAGRMPATAAADLVEWGPFPTAEQQFAVILQREVLVERVMAVDPSVPAMQDDRPINEYNLLRTASARLQWKWLETFSKR